MRPPRILCVAGARPNFAKVTPVIDAVEARGSETIFVHTGQHYDPAMSQQVIDELGLRPPDHHLGVGSGSHAEQTSAVMVGFEALVDETEPDAVVVVGDVNSTMACAVVGAKAGVPVAHVEAGLRSRDWSMPEEINRVVTDRVSDLLLAPSADACDNLRAEGASPSAIHLVGNVMIDTLLANLARARARPTLTHLGLDSGGYALVTLHRPTNVDDPAALDALMGALGQIAQSLPVIFPAHPRTSARLSSEDVPRGVRLIEPAGYLDFLALQAGARLVLTDSGGVQEETAALGVPCLTVRDATERPTTVTEGTNRVIGTDPGAVVDEARRVLDDPPAPRRPQLWDGHAGERVADSLLAVLGQGPARAPATAAPSAEALAPPKAS